MATTMWRAAKGEGVGNVFLRQVPVPDPGPEEVLTRTRVSLIGARPYQVVLAVAQDLAVPLILGVAAGLAGAAPATRVIKSPCTRPNRALEKLCVFGSLG